MEKPDEQRGWEILNEYIDKLPEAVQSAFTADARMYEGMFTSGLISEPEYREWLDRLAAL